MVTLRLDIETLAGARLSPSPAMEIAALLKLTAGSGRHPVFGDPGAAARSALTHPDVALLLDLVPQNGFSYTPDLIIPQPAPGLGSPSRILEAQLAQIESTTDDVVEEQVFGYARIHWGRSPGGRVRRLFDAGKLQRRLALGVERFWRDVLRTDWAALRPVLEQDLNERAATMAGHGVGRLLDTLHPQLTRRGSALVLGKPSVTEIDILGRDLVIAPVALSRPELVIQVDVPGQAALYYPARAGHASPAKDLTRVMGAVRSALLADLAAPRSTEDLAARHGFAKATISYHLSALHRANLVTKHRDGRFVLYTRTEHATGLVGDVTRERALTGPAPD